ncbi:hypothetical protein Nepgr_015724 [Nepenthes gracilis]|uniref:Uncharacterized protein n=1 Tax=Nepenthes gracilis TaxID=150966 RepID=A0AAD3SM84_NEPGR|nr:hypothetical protein Nepgr_015724 [Nepenthes gracilis]
MKTMREKTLVVATPPPLLLANRENSEMSPCGKYNYKIWAMAALLLLSLWSMFTGTITLKSSVGNLINDHNDIGSTTLDDLDILEVIEREKVVRQMWNVYTLGRGSKILLPRFWQDAFQAAYDSLVSDNPAVREAAVLEIAKISLRSHDLESPLVRSTETTEMNKNND